MKSIFERCSVTVRDIDRINYIESKTLFPQTSRLMKIKSLTAVTATVALSFLAIPLFAPSSQAEISVENTDGKEFPEDRVTFYCGTISESDTEKIPTTLAYVPQRKTHIPIVAWTNDSIAAWNPERRCNAVSSKFQTFYQDGRLNYLTDGQVAGEQVICALLEKQEQCSGENQLFQVRSGTDSEEVIVGIKEILKGKRSQTEVIYQSSGDRNYVSISGLLENAPGIDEEQLSSN